MTQKASGQDAPAIEAPTEGASRKDTLSKEAPTTGPHTTEVYTKEPHTTEPPTIEAATVGVPNPNIAEAVPEDDDEMHRTVTNRSTQSIASRLSRSHEVAFVFVVCMSQLMTQASLGNTIAPLQIIGKSLNLSSAGQLSWLIAAYSLTVGTFILIFGRCGDIFGHKRIFVIGFVWFALWSFIAGLAVWSTSLLFDFARALQGLGPAMLLPNALALFGQVYPPGKKKNMMFALFGATAPNGAVIGMLVGAALSEFVWWPWTYWTEAIACLAFAVMGYFCIPHIPHHDPMLEAASFRKKLRHIDPIGGALGVTALVLINISWNQAPIEGWQTAYVYFVLIIGFLVLAAFFVFETRMATYPLLPVKLLSSTVSFVLACMACGWGSFGVWIFYSVQFLIVIRGQSAMRTAVQFITCGVSGLVAAITTGVMMHKLPPPFIMAIALAAFTAGGTLIATAPVNQTFWAQTFVGLAVTTWGMDMSFPAGTVILSDAVGRRNQGLAASLINTVVNYSISLGLGIAGTVEVHFGGEATKQEILNGYRAAQYSGIGLAGLGVCVSIFFVALHRNPRDRAQNHLRILADENSQIGEGEKHRGSGSMRNDGVINEGATLRNPSRDSNVSVSISILSNGTPSLDLQPVGASLGWENGSRSTQAADSPIDMHVKVKQMVDEDDRTFRDSGFVDERIRSGGYYYGYNPRHSAANPPFEMVYVHPESETELAMLPLAHLPA